MTPSQRAELVERVAKEICREKCAFYGEAPCWDLGDEYVQETWPPDCGEPGCFALATAAIDLIRAEVLEEAARVADSYHRIVETKRDLFEDGNITVTKGHTLADPRKIAAAIRALKEKQ